MKISKIIKRALISLVFILSYTVFIVCLWSAETFGVGLDEIVFTLSAPLEGADSNVLQSALRFCLPKIAVVAGICIICSIVDLRLKDKLTIEVSILKKTFSFSFLKFARRVVAFMSVFAFASSIMYVNWQYGLFQYISDQYDVSTIYEDYYVDPEDVNIVLGNEDGKYKNLLYIYLESMETTYTSLENGGKQDICYIPNLVQLARENVTFSNTEKIGGFNNPYRTGYTMGALLSTTSGINFAFPIDDINNMDKRTNFASGLTTLGDILEDFGYNQEFLCGSKAEFGGRKKYFEQHGSYEIFDYFSAVENGYIPEGYWEFWGYEDMYLFEIAKDEITRLSKEDKPFNLTMLTVDTHHVSGNTCYLCSDEYDMQIKNVVSCTDKQVGKFIKWCKTQPFYEDTVIIITGDHPRMDNDMVEGVDYSERTIYNCFINCEVTEETKTVNRNFTPMDMFPTTLSVLGFEWEGDRLGLGTNIFSSQPTLSEEIGYDYLNGELAKKSKYYTKFY